MYEFSSEAFKNAVEKVILTYSNQEVNKAKEKADALMEIAIDLMKRRKVYQLYEVKNILDIFYASAHLYDLFIEENKISTFFLLREKASSIFDTFNIDKETQNKVFQMCECHQGEDSIADFLMPQKGMPDDLFADALYIQNYIQKTHA